MSQLWDEKELAHKYGVEAKDWLVQRMKKLVDACPSCHGTTKVLYENSLKDGVRMRCQCFDCEDMAHRMQRFGMVYFPTVPPAYRDATLGTLAPSPKSVIPFERQQMIIDSVKANPRDGYAFFGPPSSGKTFISTAMYGENLWRYVMYEEVRHRAGTSRSRWCRYFPVHRITTKKLLDEHTAWALHKPDDEDAREPSVTADKIVALRNCGITPRLFLEEIDKVRETESRRANLFEIMNTLHEQQGQLVVSSNFRPAEFERLFGDEFAWRIYTMCTKVDLFENK